MTFIYKIISALKLTIEIYAVMLSKNRSMLHRIYHVELIDGKRTDKRGSLFTQMCRFQNIG